MNKKGYGLEGGDLLAVIDLRYFTAKTNGCNENSGGK